MHRSRRQFAGTFWFRNVLLRQILRLVIRCAADAIENTLMNMDGVWDRPSASQVKPDAALPVGLRLSRYRHRIREYLRPKFSNPPHTLLRFVLILCKRVRRHIRRLPSKNVSLSILIYSKSSTFRLTNHPSQSDLGELALWLGISSSNVGMHASEPNILDVLLWVVSRTEQILPEERPALINGHRVPNDPHAWVVRCLRPREVGNVIYPADRANGVPQSHEMRFALAAKGLIEVGGDPEVDFLLLNHSNRIRNQTLIVLA